ncbi:MAG: hypothetical protein IH808_07000 [Proteobacteria bacterium]|nr:hypothetical protein [Pseudomonadota bacterium]
MNKIPITGSGYVELVGYPDAAMGQQPHSDIAKALALFSLRESGNSLLD